jgi:hypothetical protein
MTHDERLKVAEIMVDRCVDIAANGQGQLAFAAMWAAPSRPRSERAKAIAEGKLGPVLRRWINADVVPVLIAALLLREVAGAYLAGDLRGVAAALDTPTAELSERERPLRALMEWVLRGRSPGPG